VGKYRLGFAVALIVFGLDQLAKWIVTGPLGIDAIGDQLVLLPIFNFTYTENQGISLGLLNATNPVGRWMLVAVTTAIAVGVAVWIGREKNRLDQIALGMVLGGALGNILDRVLHGYVIDFLDLHFGDVRPFLVFNVGDAAISIAVAILLLRAFLARKDHPEGHEPKETIEHA
jgi:signal peptidase II